MLKKSPLSIFRGKQGQMYAVALLAWANYTGYQGDFMKKNSLYTKQLAEDQQAAIIAARDQPNVQQRRDVPKEARDTMNTNAATCRAFWQDLSSLIEKSFAQSQWSLKKSAAGGNYYLASSGDNWSATNDLNTAATDFIAENTEALTAGGMQSHFPTDFADAKKAFDGLYGTYYITKQDAKDATVEKRSASNDVFKTTMSMLSDGKKIFRDNPAVAEKFTYASLMKIVAGEGFTKTGYLFIVKDATTGLPLTAATVVFTGDKNSYSGKMGKNGNLRCIMPAGTYQYTLKAEGYATAIGTVKVKESSMLQKTIKLSQDAGSNIGMSGAEAI